MSLLTFRTYLSNNAPWLAAGGLLTLLSSFGQTFFISIFAGEIRVAFDLSHGEWGGLYSIGTTASAVVMVWAGTLTDMFRVRKLGPIVLFGLALACLAMAFNSWVVALPIVIFALRFFGQGMSSHIAMVAMARWFTKTRGKAMSIATLGFALGEATLPLVFVAAMTVVDWHLLWVISAGICLLGIPILMRLLRHERTPQSMSESYDSTGMEGRHWTRGDTLRNPLFWFMVPALLGPSAFSTAFFFHQVHFAEIKGLTHVELVAFFPVYTVLSIIAMMASGWALDKIGTPRLMPYSQLPMVAAFLFFAFGSGNGMIFAGFLFLALTAGANATLPNAFWAEFYGTAHIGSIKAMAAALMVLGSAIGPGVTGVLIDFGVGIEAQFIGVAGYFVFVTVLMVMGIRRATPSL
ncbi:MFS transporter [Phaeobacter sp. NW0010-22]|uniref:MFS transporter n=1 Tax=Phaeobacter sp. NW0010-22 TaxID=3135907 RepID=UPI0031055D21